MRINFGKTCVTIAKLFDENQCRKAAGRLVKPRIAGEASHGDGPE
jgi:hypothetical protein